MLVTVKTLWIGRLCRIFNCRKMRTYWHDIRAHMFKDKHTLQFVLSYHR